jgi:hypothetical protein
MIRFQRVLRTAGGKGVEATQWSKEITEYINDKHSEATLQVFSPRFGDVSSIVWQVDFENLAALDQYQQSLNTDEGYWTLVNKGTELFIEGSLFDTAFESL